eukprot:9074352-Karenia_brevis.AAC.1
MVWLPLHQLKSMDSATLSGPSTKRARLSLDLELLVNFTIAGSTWSAKAEPNLRGRANPGP